MSGAGARTWGAQEQVGASQVGREDGGHQHGLGMVRTKGFSGVWDM